MVKNFYFTSEKEFEQQARNNQIAAGAVCFLTAIAVFATSIFPSFGLNPARADSIRDHDTQPPSSHVKEISNITAFKDCNLIAYKGNEKVILSCNIR